nr:hypothetical protein [Actinacidiphila soli]
MCGRQDGDEGLGQRLEAELCFIGGRLAQQVAADGPGRGQAVREVGEGSSSGAQQFPAFRDERDASRSAAEQRVAEVEFVGEHNEGVQLREGELGAVQRQGISDHARGCIRRICPAHLAFDA